MDIAIRIETPADRRAVEELTREAFWDTHWGEDARTICTEHLLVSRLRNCASLVPELDIIRSVMKEYKIKWGNCHARSRRAPVLY